MCNILKGANSKGGWGLKPLPSSYLNFTWQYIEDYNKLWFYHSYMIPNSTATHKNPPKNQALSQDVC